MEISLAFEDKVDALIFGCYAKMDDLLMEDIKDEAYQIKETDSQTVVNTLKTKLEKRYGWVGGWLVIVTRKNWDFPSEAKFPNKNGYQHLPEGQDKRHIVVLPLPADSGPCPYQFAPKGIQVLDEFMKLCSFNFTLEGNDDQPKPCKKEEFHDLPEYIEGHLSATGVYHHTDLVYVATNADHGPSVAITAARSAMLQRRRPLVKLSRETLTIDANVVIRSECEPAPSSHGCNRAFCHNRGQCHRIPFTGSNFCKCDRGYQGERCTHILR